MQMSDAQCVHTGGVTNALRDHQPSQIILRDQERALCTFHYKVPTALYRATATYLRILAMLYQTAQGRIRVAFGQQACCRVAPLAAIRLTRHQPTLVVQLILLEAARGHGLMTIVVLAWRDGGHAITVTKLITQLWHLSVVHTALIIDV